MLVLGKKAKANSTKTKHGVAIFRPQVVYGLESSSIR